MIPYLNSLIRHGIYRKLNIGGKYNVALILPLGRRIIIAPGIALSIFTSCDVVTRGFSNSTLELKETQKNEEEWKINNLYKRERNASRRSKNEEDILRA